MKLASPVLLIALTAGLAVLAMAGRRDAVTAPERAADSQVDVDAWFV